MESFIKKRQQLVGQTISDVFSSSQNPPRRTISNANKTSNPNPLIKQYLNNKIKGNGVGGFLSNVILLLIIILLFL